MMEIQSERLFSDCQGSSKGDDSQEGNIIRINSKSGKKGSYKNSAYATSKLVNRAHPESGSGLAVHGIALMQSVGNLLDSRCGPTVSLSSTQKPGHNRRGKAKVSEPGTAGRSCQYEDSQCYGLSGIGEASYMTGRAINVTGGQEMR